MYNITTDLCPSAIERIQELSRREERECCMGFVRYNEPRIGLSLPLSLSLESNHWMLLYKMQNVVYSRKLENEEELYEKPFETRGKGNETKFPIVYD